MSFIRFNNAEGTASGTTVSAANSGGTSGYAFDAVSGPVTFDNAQFFTGAQSYKFVTSANTAYIQVFIPTATTSLTTIYSRCYVQFLTSVFTDVALIYAASTGSGSPFKVAVSSAKLVAYSGTQNTSGVTTLSAGTWYRIEVQMTPNTIAPTTVVRLYDSSGTLLETITATGNASATGTQYVSWGSVTSATTGTMWIDEPAVSDQGWIGTATGSSIGALSKSNNALSGTPGTTVSSANSGGLSGDAFDVINSSPVYSATVLRPSGGWLDYYCGISQNMQWNLPGTSTDLYARSYMYATANPVGGLGAQNFRAGSSSYAAASLATATAKLTVYANGATNSAGTYVAQANTWYRIETHVYISVTAGYAEAYLYNLAGTQLDYAKTTTNGNTVGITNAYLGQGGYSLSVYCDSLALSDVTWCGPAADVPSHTNKRNSAFLDIMG